MTQEQAQAAIEAALAERKTKVANRNAFKALLGAFTDPVSALGQVFIGRQEALDDERHKLEQEAVLAFVCRIDQALSETLATLRAGDASPVIVQGLIETNAINTRDVTGVHVSSDTGPVEFKSGTHIRTTGVGVSNLTGLRIGGGSEKK